MCYCSSCVVDLAGEGGDLTKVPKMDLLAAAGRAEKVAQNLRAEMTARCACRDCGRLNCFGPGNCDPRDLPDPEPDHIC